MHYPSQILFLYDMTPEVRAHVDRETQTAQQSHGDAIFIHQSNPHPHINLRSKWRRRCWGIATTTFSPHLVRLYDVPSLLAEYLSASLDNSCTGVGQHPPKQIDVSYTTEQPLSYYRTTLWVEIAQVNEASQTSTAICITSTKRGLRHLMDYYRHCIANLSLH